MLAALVLQSRRHRRHVQQRREDLDTLKSRLEATDRDLSLSQKRCRQVLDNAGDALFFIDPRDGRLLESNRSAEDLLGYSAEELSLLSLSVLFPHNHQRRYLRLVKRVMKDGYGEEGNLLFRCRDGRQFIGAVHARLGELGDSRVVHGVLRDVSHIKQTEQELRQKNKDLMLVNRIAHQAAGSRNLAPMLSTVLQEVVAHLEADGGGIYLVRNKEESLDLVVSQNIDEAVAADLRRIRPGQGLAGRVASSGQPRSSVELCKDRRLKSEVVRDAGWCGFQAVPLISNECNIGVLFIYSMKRRIFVRDEVRLLLAIGRQIGTAVEGGQLFEALNWQNRLTRASNRELERSREQLRQHLVKLEEATRTMERVERMKSQFLALASHELRTPLTYVLSGSEHLLEQLRDRIKPDEYRFLEAIYQGGARLNEIVQNLLEVAQLESQSIYLAKEDIDPALILGRLDSEFRPIAEQRGLQLDVNLPEGTPILHGDPEHLHKTFRRLVENAVKFTREGGRIAVSATTRSNAEVQGMLPDLRPFSPTFFQNAPEGPYLQVTVADTGIGIDPEDRFLVFDKFYESGDIAGHFTSTTRFGGKGVGLGLTLVKGMVETHGGLVWHDRAGAGDDTGSAFHVLLPLRTPEDNGDG